MPTRFTLYRLCCLGLKLHGHSFSLSGFKGVAAAMTRGNQSSSPSCCFPPSHLIIMRWCSRCRGENVYWRKWGDEMVSFRVIFPLGDMLCLYEIVQERDMIDTRFFLELMEIRSFAAERWIVMTSISTMVCFHGSVARWLTCSMQFVCTLGLCHFYRRHRRG